MAVYKTHVFNAILCYTMLYYNIIPYMCTFVYSYQYISDNVSIGCACKRVPGSDRVVGSAARLALRSRGSFVVSSHGCLSRDLCYLLCLMCCPF